MPSDRWHTGRVIRALLRERGMTAEAFAAKLGRSRAYLYMLFREEQWPPEYIQSAASILGLNPDYLSGAAPHDRSARDWVPVVALPTDVLAAFDTYRTDCQLAELRLKQSLAAWVSVVESRASAEGISPAALLNGTPAPPTKYDNTRRRS